MMRNVSGFLWRRGLLLMAAIFVAVLGNMRPLTLQAATRNHVVEPVSIKSATNASSGDSFARLVPAADPFRFENASGGKDMEQDGSAVAPVDDGQLVPAIYSWDPDVRFIYYRHISKWM